MWFRGFDSHRPTKWSFFPAPMQGHHCRILSNRVSAGVVLLRILQAAPCYASFLQLGVCFGKLGGGFRGALRRLMAGTGLPGHGTLNRRRRGPQVEDCCHCSWRVVFGLPAYVDAVFSLSAVFLGCVNLQACRTDDVKTFLQMSALVAA